MSVTFFAHKQKLIDAYKDVLNDNTDTVWALFSYEGNQNELKLHATGDEGLDELESEFNSGKIMYAFVRVDDPNTNLKKFILIVWQGDGVPATRKGACANHVKDINRFFKGSHVTIYARNEDDVTPDEIMRQVLKSTTNFTFVAPKEDHSSQPAPVGSVYKRVNPEQEIKALKDDSFWLKAQQEEDERKKEDKKREIERRRLAAMELREQEARSEENRNKLVKAREKDISEKTKAQRLADDKAEIRSQEKKRWEQLEAEQEASFRESRRTRGSQSGSVYKRVNPEQEIKALKDDSFWLKAQQEEDERKKEDKKREIERRRLAAMELREQEARSEENRNKLVKAREKDISEKTKAQRLADEQAKIRSQEKKRWEQQEADQEASLRELRKVRRSQSIEHAHEAEQLVSQRSNNPRALWAQREKQASQGPPPVRKYSSSGSKTSSISEYPAEPMQESLAPEPSYPSEPEPSYPSEPEPSYPSEPALEPEPIYKPEPSAQQEQKYQPNYQEQKYQPEPDYQHQNYQSESGYQQEQNHQQEPDYQQQPNSYHQLQEHHEPSQQNEGYDDQAQYANEAAGAYDETPDESYQPAYGNVPEMSARALYDYQAADDSEITFDPGDVITNIEQIDEGWWRGQAPDGSYGLFPANYVELV